MGQVSVVLKIHAVSYPLHESLWIDYDNHFHILELDIIIIESLSLSKCNSFFTQGIFGVAFDEAKSPMHIIRCKSTVIFRS
jgi:hypothetical protein